MYNAKSKAGGDEEICEEESNAQSCQNKRPGSGVRSIPFLATVLSCKLTQHQPSFPVPGGCPRLAAPSQTPDANMRHGDLMNDPHFADIMMHIETTIHQHDQIMQQERGIRHNDSEAKTALRNALGLLRGKVPKNAREKSVDQLAAILFGIAMEGANARPSPVETTHRPCPQWMNRSSRSVKCMATYGVIWISSRSSSKVPWMIRWK